MLEIVMPRNYVNITAGVVSLVFERLGAMRREMQRPMIEPVVAVETAVVEPPMLEPVIEVVTAVMPPIPDDLTKIKGIGPTFARRLQEAGLDSYAKLSAATPEQIKEAAKLAVWQGNPAEWIVTAGVLARD